MKLKGEDLIAIFILLAKSSVPRKKEIMTEIVNYLDGAVEFYENAND